MRLRNIKNSEEIMKNSKHLINEPHLYKGKWQDVFNNKKPIHLEIGIGLGNFILENAKKNPQINYIGVEKFTKVLVRALKKIEEEELPNLKLILIDALEIDNIFFKEIDCLFLNFSDPWPKDKHINRRLTSDVFIEKYQLILKRPFKIIQKTDNYKLYLYSLSQYQKYKFICQTIEYSLKNIPDNNIQTEYETKFLNQGNSIYKIDVSLS